MLILIDPVPELFDFRSADWPENYFSGQSAGRNSNTSGNKCPRVLPLVAQSERSIDNRPLVGFY